MSLLKSINSEIQEGPRWDALKTLATGKSSAPSAAPAATAAPTKPALDAADIAKADKGGDNNDMSHLSGLVAEVVATPDVRYVIHLSETNLKALYLKNGGGKTLIDKIEDADIVATAKLESNLYFSMFKAPLNFKFAMMFKPAIQADMAVILNIPKSLSDKLESAANANDPNQAREVLNAMMSFKYYICTLRIKAANAVAPKIDAAESSEEKAEFFNPSLIVKQHPVKATLESAKAEWYEQFGAGKEEKDVEALAGKAERAQSKAASEKTLRSAKPDASIENAIISRLLTGGKVLSIADGLFASYKDKYDKDEMIALLTTIDGKFNAPLIKNVIDAILHGVDGRKSSWG